MAAVARAADLTLVAAVAREVDVTCTTNAASRASASTGGPVSKRRECPEIVIGHIPAYTSAVGGGTLRGLVTGTGPTPDDAVSALCARAAQHGRDIVRNAWEQDAGRLHIEAGNAPDSMLRASLILGMVRLASGPVDGQPGWVAYGTIMTDGSIISRWLTVEAPGGACAPGPESR